MILPQADRETSGIPEFLLGGIHVQALLQDLGWALSKHFMTLLLKMFSPSHHYEVMYQVMS